MLTRRTISILGLLALIASGGFAQTKVVVKEQITITVDRNTVRTDVPPIMVQDRTLVPIRGIFEAFNAQIDWLPDVKRVHILRDPQEIWLRIGVTHAKVDNRLVPLDVAPLIYRNRTMVPLRFIAETLGATVSWDPATQTITILTRQVAQPMPAKPATPAPPVVVPAPPTTEAPPSTAPQQEAPPSETPQEQTPQEQAPQPETPPAPAPSY